MYIRNRKTPYRLHRAFQKAKRHKNYKKYLYITALLKSLIKKVAKVKNCTFAKIRISGLYNFIIK